MSIKQKTASGKSKSKNAQCTKTIVYHTTAYNVSNAHFFLNASSEDQVESSVLLCCDINGKED